MKVKIKDIKVKKRIRQDLGDLENLKESLTQYGLLNPITINSKNELVAGERRLQAAKALEWTEIEANVVETNDKLTLLELELEENNQRKPFTNEELIEGYKALEKLRNPGFFTKLKNRFSRFFQKQFDSEIESKPEIKTRNGLLSLLIILGLGLVVLGAALFKHALIPAGFRTFIVTLGFLVFIAGALFLAKFISGFINKR